MSFQNIVQVSNDGDHPAQNRVKLVIPNDVMHSTEAVDVRPDGITVDLTKLGIVFHPVAIGLDEKGSHVILKLELGSVDLKGPIRE